MKWENHSCCRLTFITSLWRSSGRAGRDQRVDGLSANTVTPTSGVEMLHLPFWAVINVTSWCNYRVVWRCASSGLFNHPPDTVNQWWWDRCRQDNLDWSWELYIIPCPSVCPLLKHLRLSWLTTAGAMECFLILSGSRNSFYLHGTAQSCSGLNWWWFLLSTSWTL